MIIRFSCILFLAISGVSFSDAQRAFAGGFDGADFLNVNNGGNEPTLRGFDPNMRIPRFQNRRLGELPRPLQIEVINALIANGVRGSRVNNGFTAGVGGANNAAINTRRFTINGAQGRTFGVDTLTATGMNGGGVAGRRFTVNNRFGDSLSTTRIGRIPPPGNGGQTIDLAATRATGRIGGRPAVRTTTRITGGMPRSGILGGLGGNVDDLFLDPVSGRRVLVRPIGVANNLVNQRTNGDGGIGGGFTDPAGGNGFRRLPTSTFAGGPQTNLRRSQLPIFPPGGMAGTIRNTNFNRGVPNDRVSPFPFSGMQTDMISNNVAPQPIALSSLEPFSENFMARQQFNFPPPGFDAGRPRVPPARPPPGLGSLPGPESPPMPGITFPRQPPVDVNPSTTSGTSVGSRSTQFPRSRSSGTTAFGQTSSQNLRTLNFQPVRGTMSQTFQRNPQPPTQRNPEPLIRSGNASIDVQVDDFLSSLDALIAAEESVQGLSNTQNSQAASRTSNTNIGANIFSNGFTLPTSLPDPAFQRNNQRSSRPLNSQTNSFLWAGNTVQSLPTVSGNNNSSVTSSVSHSTSVRGRNSGIGTSGVSSIDSTGRTNSRLVLSRGTIQDNTGTNVINTAFSANNQQLNSISPATQNLNSAIQTFNAANAQQIANTAFPSQSPQDLRRGAMNSIQTLITSGAADSSGFFLEGQGPQQDFSNSLTFDSVNPALFSSGPDTTTVDSDIRSIALPRATIDRIPITPTVRRGSRININLRPLRPAGGTAGAISSMSRSRGFNVDGNVDIDIGVPTSINRGQGGIGIDIPDTRATIDMTSRVPATSSRMETTRTTTRFTGDSTGVAGSRIDPIDNTIDNTIDRSGVGLDASAASVKTTSIKKIGVDGVTDVGTSGSVTRTTTTTTTRRLAEAGITGDSALSIEKQLNAIEQQLVAAAGVDRPVFAVIPMNEKANQADFNEFLRNMTNANQVNIINRKSTTSTNTINTIGGGVNTMGGGVNTNGAGVNTIGAGVNTIDAGVGVDNSMGGMMTVDGNMGNGGAVDGSSSSFSSSFESSSSSTRTSSTTTSGDTSMAGNAGAGTGGITKIKKTTIFRRTSPTGNVGTADVGFDGFGADVGGSMSSSFVNDGGMSTSFVNDGVTGGFTTGGMASAGTMSDGSGIIDTGLVDPGPVDMGVSGSFTNGAFPTDLPPMNDVTAMPDPMPL